jgi:hypothetical protein
MLYRLIASVSLAASSLLFSGCAAIVTGTEQTISVETPGCTGARCKLVNDKGTWYVSDTPGTVTVHRAYSALTVTCSKNGIQNEEVGVATSSTKGMAFGNILFGGIIGAGVDVGTGAAYDYPKVVSIPMDCGDASGVAAAPEPGPTQPTGTANSGAGTVAGVDSGVTQDCLALQHKLDDAATEDFARQVAEKSYQARCMPATPAPSTN